MYLLLWIILSGVLGMVLMLMGPQIGGVIAFAIVLGCILRGLDLLYEINKRLETTLPKRDKVQQAYDEYLKEKEKENDITS